MVVYDPATLGGNGDVCRFSRVDFGVDFQLAHEEPVGHVFAMQTQGDRLPFFQRDLFRHKTEPFRCDFDNARLGRIRPTRHGYSPYQCNR